jgi:hypothetical protein
VSSRRARGLAVTAVIAACGAFGVGIAVAGGSRSPSPRYGGLPSFLPRSSLHPDSTLTGTTGRPALTSEGDSVRVQSDHRSVVATVAGPVVPGEGLPYQPSATTATWTVTLTGASAPVPIRLSTFSAVDSQGQVYRLAFVPGQPRPPAQLDSGQTARFEVRAVTAVGEGTIRWAPYRNDVLAIWDYTVEND